MRYLSTRDTSLRLNFKEVVDKGLSDDGGLFLPKNIPLYSESELKKLAQMKYDELAQFIISVFADDTLSGEELHQLLRCLKHFRDDRIVPLISHGHTHVLELFHGPTYSFKDIALQFLGGLFELWPGKNGRRTILGATSGDTGSAALHGLRGKKGIQAFILFPEGRVSPVQELQMTTLPDDNIHCISVRGSFDDCQNLVKMSFADRDFRESVSLSAVNSINWARITAQIVYYFSGYFQWLSHTGHPFGTLLPCSVPTGNFGDIFAGHMARLMGLPLKPLIIASNENDILTRFHETGSYTIRHVVPTTSPSMDIQISSNFERLLFLLYNKADYKIEQLMKELQSGEFTVDPQVWKSFKEQFQAARVNEQECSLMIQSFYQENKTLIDPHTAIGIAAARKIVPESKDVMCLATAHPAKFLEATEKACQRVFPLPDELEALKKLKPRKVTIDNSVDEVKKIIQKEL